MFLTFRSGTLQQARWLDLVEIQCLKQASEGSPRSLANGHSRSLTATTGAPGITDFQEKSHIPTSAISLAADSNTAEEEQHFATNKCLSHSNFSQDCYVPGCESFRTLHHFTDKVTNEDQQINCGALLKSTYETDPIVPVL